MRQQEEPGKAVLALADFLKKVSKVSGESNVPNFWGETYLRVQGNSQKPVALVGLPVFYCRFLWVFIFQWSVSGAQKVFGKQQSI